MKVVYIGKKQIVTPIKALPNQVFDISDREARKLLFTFPELFKEVEKKPKRPDKILMVDKASRRKNGS